jgi:hypothetical protein
MGIFLLIYATLYEISVASRRILHKILKQFSFLRLTRDSTAPMKALIPFKLLLMIALAACMHLLTTPAKASVATLPASSAIETVKSQASLPETSSIVLIGAVGIMLMLRRRRLHA